MPAKHVGHKLACVGVDQSYARTGISLTVDGHLVLVKSVDLSHYDTKRDKRKIVSGHVRNAVQSCFNNNCRNVIVLLERIRLFSKDFISQPYIMSMGAMNACIADTVYNAFPEQVASGNLEVMSVETRAWKSSVVGTTKKQENMFGVPPEKWPTVEYMIRNYPEFRDSIMHPSKRQKKSKKNFSFLSDDSSSIVYMEYDNDACDSACISLFPWSRSDWPCLLELVD